jgi:hypothetical protein
MVTDVAAPPHGERRNRAARANSDAMKELVAPLSIMTRAERSPTQPRTVSRCVERAAGGLVADNV